METLKKAIKDKALELGFDLVGITDSSPIPPDHIEYLKRWLESGYAGQMAYMRRNFEKRICPALLLDGAKSVICVGLNYKPAQTAKAQNSLNLGKVAAYACCEDYHKFIREKLNLLADFIKVIAPSPFDFKGCVDSVPLVERSIAARAGLGFIAKNHMLTHPVLGQQIFLGQLITTIELTPDAAIDDGCAACCECVKACPTGALEADGTFDARKCISYLTIEHKDVIPQGLSQKMGNWVFGCSECIAACPRQKNAPPASNRSLKFYEERQMIDLYAVMTMDESGFRAAFSNSPILRTGLEKIKRNAAICLQNCVKS